MYSLLLTSNGKDVCFSLYCEGNSKKKADTCFSISSVVLCFCCFFFSSQPEIPMLRNNSLHCRHSRSRVKVAACLSLALDILCVWLPHSASPPYHIIYVKKKKKKKRQFLKCIRHVLHQTKYLQEVISGKTDFKRKASHLRKWNCCQKDIYRNISQRGR